MGPGSAHAGCQRGFTYLGVLALIVLIGILLAAAGEVARTSAQRQHEDELLWVGHQYRGAIARYVGQYHRYPPSLAALLGNADAADSAAPASVGPAFRAIRRLYRDPMTNSMDWVLLPAADGGVKGIASHSTQAPFKSAGFDDTDVDFDKAKSYTDWTFYYEPIVPGRRIAPPAARAS